MIVDLIDKLADRILQLINYRKEAKKEVINDFISPIFSDFDKVHGAYLECFSEYRESLNKPISEWPGGKILDRISKDNLFTAHQRAKIIEMVMSIENEDPRISSFLFSVAQYLGNERFNVHNEGEYRLVGSQVWRNGLYDVLGDIFIENWIEALNVLTDSQSPREEAVQNAITSACNRFQIPESEELRIEKLKQKLAVKALDDIVHDMQAAYQRIAAQYTELKVELYSGLEYRTEK